MLIEKMKQALYIFDDIEKLDEEFLKRSSPYLSEQRREKAFSYRFALDQNLSAAVYLLLRFALKEKLGIDEPVEFSYGKYGKPFLRDYQKIHFSLSHCKNAAACVISDNEIGVDVQEIIPVSDDLAFKVLTAKEYAAFKASTDPSRLFCEYWTVKESHFKRTGQGITADLTALSADDVNDKTLINNGKSYCCCVAGTLGQIEPNLCEYQKKICEEQL